MVFRTIALLFFSPLLLLAQNKHDYVWVLGSNGMPSDTTVPSAARFGVNILDFNQGELNITRKYQDSNYFLTHASMSNVEGELLFTSNGCQVFQADGEVMENGGGLNPGASYSTGNCPEYGNPVIKGVLILPLPESDSLYYLLHKSLVWGDDNLFLLYPGILYTSVVDMSGNNGLGVVIEKNTEILVDTLLDDLHAVRHANGIDWWIMSSSLNKNTYYTILFTAIGIANIFEQEIGPVSIPGISGASIFSPNGSRFARHDKGVDVLLYDFDRESGQLSNLQQLHADTFSNAPGRTISFSPSGRFLYVASDKELYQFDLESSDVQASRVLIGEYDGFKYLDIFPADFGFMQLAPNCRIYMSTRSSTPFYHVINYPDSKGHECGFEQRGQPLIATTASSIPNNPNYNLGTGFPVCDSTIQLVVSSVSVLPPRREVLVFPNPATDEVTVRLPRPSTGRAEWSLYSAVGQRVVSQVLERGMDEALVSLVGVPTGLYFWEVRSEGGQISGGKLVVTK